MNIDEETDGELETKKHHNITSGLRHRIVKHK